MAILRLQRRLKNGLVIYLLFCLWVTFGAETFFAEETLSMHAGSYALMDGNSGRILKGKNERLPMSNASTTKILTCIVTLESCQLDEKVEISANAASQPKVRWGIREGESYLLKDLLYGLMLESYNDCAVAIAEHVAGSETVFAARMNEKAKEIGCVDTYFITPNGLDEEDKNGFHHTTSADLCRIMAYCTWESPKKDLFLEITQTRAYGEFVNRNAFLDQMDILTGKTGFTSKAGYCYVAALEDGEERYCIALLACGWPDNKTYKWQDAKTLFFYALETYDVKEVVVEEKKKVIDVDGWVGERKLENLNQSGKLCLTTNESRYQMLLSEKDMVETELILHDDIQLPIQKGQKLGECHVYLNGTEVDQIPLYADTEADAWTFQQILGAILLRFLTFSS